MEQVTVSQTPVQKESSLIAAGSATFDRTLHNPPRIDKNGFIKDQSIKDAGGKRNALYNEHETKVPNWWGGQKTSNPRKTKTELLAMR